MKGIFALVTFVLLATWSAAEPACNCDCRCNAPTSTTTCTEPSTSAPSSTPSSTPATIDPQTFCNQTQESGVFKIPGDAMCSKHYLQCYTYSGLWRGIIAKCRQNQYFGKLGCSENVAGCPASG